MSARPWFVFAGGGTGGHLFPALGVVEHLREQRPDIEITFFCTNRPIDQEILGKASVPAQPQSVQPIPAVKYRWPIFLWHWQRSIAACVRTFRQRRPAAVVGAGGYASDPPIRAALRLKIPAFLLNPDAVPGQANRRVAHRDGITAVFAQWEASKPHFPPSSPLEITGCPVRSTFRKVRTDNIAAIRQELDLNPNQPTLLVTGASQGAQSINEAMMRLGANLPKSWQIMHLSGTADRVRVEQAYRDSAMPARVIAFTDRMPEAMAAANLIVSRAGASTLAEILAMGKPSVLLPYPYHKDQHQKLNGQVLVDAEAACMLTDQKNAEANASQLGPLLHSLMTAPDRLQKMGEAARKLDRPNAAEVIAERLCAAAGLDAKGG
jgi:UDP-N-acetylglucosamine--N-acetylmuramyl-(pentapeptide) pyrophosphoryl-undecaprenol N-acetylglucosamine transferase